MNGATIGAAVSIVSAVIVANVQIVHRNSSRIAANAPNAAISSSIAPA